MNRSKSPPDVRCEDEPHGPDGCECWTLFGVMGDTHLTDGQKDALLDFFSAVTHGITETLVQTAAITAELALSGEEVQAVVAMIHEDLEAKFDGRNWIDVTAVDPADIASWIHQAASVGESPPRRRWFQWPRRTRLG